MVVAFAFDLAAGLVVSGFTGLVGLAPASHTGTGYAV